MSELKVRWKWDTTFNSHRGYLPGKDQPDYDIIGHRDGSFALYGWIGTGVTFHGLFLDLESAEAHAEKLEANR